MIANESFQVSKPSPREVMMTRSFNAPPRLVFEAMTKPEHIRRWYGPHGFTVTHCETDLRVGGAYRIVQRAPDGSEFGFRGVHREIIVPTRRVYTWIFEPMPDKEAVITETFENVGGQTAFAARILFATQEDRDGYLSTGASEGGAQTYNRLDEVLKTMTGGEAR
jgi:uncharacterized protein YndB with AHSA1/START domain